MEAEYFHSQGMYNQNLYQLQLAINLFPFDFRYREGFIQVADLDNLLITPLLQIQKLEPKSINLRRILINHMMNVHDYKGAEEQFKALYKLAPDAPFTRFVLSQRKIP
jgi:hypothetical protein